MPRNIIKDLALLLCLFAPSAWMIVNIPPLWRDMDAYNQVTKPPLVATYWGHGPAYCYVAKIPLWLGEQWESRAMGNVPAIAKTQNSPTILTDTGVWLLIIAQHLALCAAAFSFITAIANPFWIRVGLALLWASNALFYTFAHCVGSETLSMILIIVLVTQGLRLIRRGQANTLQWKDWYLFAVTLLLCLLSRHVNLWLIALLPGALVISAILNSERKLKTVRFAFVALLVGLMTLLTTNLLINNLARKTRLRPHSRIGFTFLWRLHFLKGLPPDTRAALFQKIGARTNSVDTRKLLALLEEMESEQQEVNAGEFMNRAIPLLFPNGTVEWTALDRKINQMAWAFLLPPTSEHLRATRTDLSNAFATTVTSPSAWLFETTAYYFQHREEMSACASLITFANTSADEIRQIPRQHPWFQLWNGVTYPEGVAVWLISLIGLIVLGRRKQISISSTAGLGVALVLVGALTIVSTCLIGEFVPRYCLPMWQLLLLSIWVLVGTIGDLVGSKDGQTLRALLAQGPAL